MRTISEIWPRIRAHQNEQFHLKLGKKFAYTVDGNILTLDCFPDYPVHAGQFEKALTRVPLAGPNGINDLRAPSYVWAILHDARVRQTDW